VKALLEKGADVNMKDNNKKTALDYALSNGHEEIASLLLQKISK
jgi:ankyrin repeat protein